MARIVQVWGAVQSEQSPGELHFPHSARVDFITADITCVKFPSCSESVPSLALKRTVL